MMRRPRLVELLGLAACGLWTAAAVASQRAARKTHWLEDIPEAADDRCPSLSMVIPACNEAATLEPALRSVLSVDYPRLKAIVVNDRSTDETGAILDRLAAADPRIHAVHVTALPAGWLGKNHALSEGASASDSEWILFTDADVLFRPDALRRAARAAALLNADHLVAAPGVILKGFWERLTVSYFGVMFSLFCRTWAVDDPDSDAAIGIGAFNMVRRSAYEAIGGHSSLAMEVADDVKLGRLIKSAGFRQRYVIGGDLVKVRWVEGLAGFVQGLSKNFFAGLEYRWTRVIGVTIVVGATHIYPAVGSFRGTRLSRLLFTLAWLQMAVCVMLPRRNRTGRPQWEMSPEQRALQDAWDETAATRWPLYGLAFPLAAVVWLCAMWNSAVTTQIRGGITWRGTFYSLGELRGEKPGA